MLHKFSTTKKITLLFSVYNFFSLVVLLWVINCAYFFIWYTQQKEESLHDMNMKYSLFSMPDSDMEVEEFKQYLLEKDTLIITDHGETVCSNSLEDKIHDDIETIKKSYFYKYNNKIYFIFSQNYEKIGSVKVLFDTTPYIKSQIIIIQISIWIILFFTIINFWVWKIVSRKMLFSLKRITEEVKDIDLGTDKKVTVPQSVQHDEVRVLAESMNNMIWKLQHQADKLQQFITDVSHEFKTPLMAMNSYLDVNLKKLETSGITKQKAWENIEYLKKNIKKLNQILESLFYLARLESWLQKPPVASLDMHLWIQKKIQEVSEAYREAHIVLKENVEPGTYEKVNESFLSIVLENLISNAVKFSKTWWKVEVCVTSTYIKVRDYWVGIHPQDIEKIWEKFYKANVRQEWFWIGLFLVKRICDTFSRKIEIESVHWKWTTFTLYFE